MADLPKLITPKQAAAETGLPVDQIRRLCADEEIDCLIDYRADGLPRYRFTREALNGWIRRQMHHAAVARS